ncbi:hypothetical protein FC50_GL000479 [Lacticaseibacillus pantheris DSM 15945 = JCM 12539 = NBRC 106106]|uniref:Exodeoxyribonuclease 7 small subunit n=1 Tax=Lacticaseibacillus pantheris DSM 15945 = JCM 12539 = NBRC 106106 TaxID=1423783 RepID=A0A0R1U029_9LACO|nr:exodeoxyribonuclease VII small subunit [Lacticaseibacillus pantheris]KRL86832.1 hypothetical protein FC50_GL000479 [Lacticaseibacillus pantheris DSM 15945 = JCM 12539 = NBRC 106106]
MAEAKEPSFEEQLAELEQIVGTLEKGDVPLEKALSQFQTGVALAKQLDGTLKDAETAVAQVMTDNGELKDFEPEQTD